MHKNMTEESAIYYLYRHIRLDKNEPFYIGVGKKRKNRNFKTVDREYTRAYSKQNRNLYWNNVVNSFGYKVEILMESNNSEFIKEKEIEFIALYGRKDLNTGILVNMTKGGDGCFLLSEGAKIKMKNNLLNPSEKMIAFRKKLKEFPCRNKLVYQYDLEGNFIKEWKSIKDICKILHTYPTGIVNCAKGNKNSHAGFQWKLHFEGILIPQVLPIKPKYKIQQIEKLTNSIVNEFFSVKEVVNTIIKVAPFTYKNVYYNISQVINGYSKTAYGFIWVKTNLL